MDIKDQVLKVAEMSDAANLKFTSVNDLIRKSKLDFKGKEPRYIYTRLPTMRERSDNAKKKGDDESAYILLRRWLDSVEWLKRTQDYKDGKSIYSTNMTVDQV